MKLTVLQSNFAKALNQVGRVVGARTTLPVLSNILITAAKGRIELSATDLEIGVIARTIGKVEEEGEITLPAKLLTDFILNNKDESVELSTIETKAKLKSNHFEADIMGISPDEFPKIPTITKKDPLLLPKELFINNLKKVAIAPANDETRPVLAGVYFHFSGKTLTLAATDSYRLAESQIPLENEVPDQKLIVPARTINEVIRLTALNDSEEIAILSTENQVSFKINETEIVSRLIEGSFPNYQQIIPAASKIKITLNFADLLAAVKMSSLFAKDSSNNNVMIKSQKDEVVVSSAVSQTGNSKSSVPALVDGGEIEIAFNARYILDVLQVVESQKITLLLNDQLSAGVIKSPDDKNFLYIIMPLKLDN